MNGEEYTATKIIIEALKESVKSIEYAEQLISELSK